jgi:hypothetical protein
MACPGGRPAYAAGLIGLLALTASARGATFLLLDSVPDLPNDPLRGLVSSPAGAFTGSVTGGPGTSVQRVGIDVQVTCSEVGCRPGTVSLSFATPLGVPLTPGTYAGATDLFDPTRPSLTVYFNSATCSVASGRFVVYELELDPAGNLRSFAADFTQACQGTVGTFAGAIRFHAGDWRCDHGDGGCNDYDPCTHDDQCLAGSCRGAAPPGACSALTCSDDDPCTDDAVDETGGCVHTRIPGSCWALAVRTRLVVRALGRSCGCGLPPSSSLLALRDDGGYSIPGGHIDASLCPTRRAVDVPDEAGTWSQRRKRVRRLEATNLDDLLAASEACAGELALKVRGYHTRVRLSRDGTHLTGKQILRGKVIGAPATASIVSRVQGTPVTHGTAPPISITPTELGAVTQRCQARITACFRR